MIDATIRKILSFTSKCILDIDEENSWIN